MARLFENNVTKAGRQTTTDLTDHVAQVWNETLKTHGPDCIEAAQEGLILASFYCVVGEHKRADPLIRNYIYVAEERYGLHSDEVLCGLILLSNNCMGWGRPEESRFALERVKSVRERCSFSRDSILEGLQDLAGIYHGAEEPANKQRGFILSLLALSWCVRYPNDPDYLGITGVKVAGLHNIYTRHVPQLEAIFQSYGFVNDYWQWLIRHCNNNLNDLVGLVSILLDKQLLPAEGRPSLTTAMREEALAALVQEFPIHKDTGFKRRILKSGGNPLELKFVCPLCGSQDLRTKFPEPLYQISTLDAVKKDPGANGDPWYIDEREPSEYEGVGHTDEWEFWCDKCGLAPYLEQNHEEESQEESLARWLLDNCPQDEDLPSTENKPSAE
ncbi:hypothetical protein [Desulfomonile tiedjei]|uniref:Uncharacterized protein n=1 Tax=Desulfomonile tiedjei (strain ATCC 49306 / DSM 6799 / DCB-1) TaxID=706587 RepID=I4C905_DESTA|nr:hypothetical protein [Desulfomonile tiedjei]AFM26046.1 hypothetical protein Desti_3391 [Desulfomonile tiedjei DSM 6799]